MQLSGCRLHTIPMQSLDQIPRSIRGLRCCLLCSLLKSSELFERDGCDNCERYLRISGSRERLISCTTTNFYGIITLMDPTESWVAKWQFLDKYVPGCYAISVTGSLPSNVIEDLHADGIEYFPRDSTLSGNLN